VAATRELITRFAKRPSGGITEGCHDEGYWLRVAPGEVDEIARVLGKGS
jgi:hypothetical protein